jgi:hypothetical protein
MGRWAYLAFEFVSRDLASKKSCSVPSRNERGGAEVGVVVVSVFAAVVVVVAVATQTIEDE